MKLHGSCPAVQHEGSAKAVLNGEDGNISASSRSSDGEVVELDLLLTSAEATALETAAQANGMTVACLLRSVIRDGLARWVVPVARFEASQERGS